MKKKLFFLLISFSQKCYCQENMLLPADSLLKVNKVKKVIMKSKSVKGSGSGTNIYYYSRSGELVKHETLSPVLNEPFIITDYFFDSAGRRYASVMHGGEASASYSASSTGYSWRFTSGFSDSIVYYYEYNLNKQFSRIYRLFPSGKKMFESAYSYGPKTITRRSFNEEQKLTGETTEYYEKEQFIVQSVSKKYDNSGAVISTFTQDFANTYNSDGQLAEINYRNDTCSCVSKYKYYANGLVKSHSNVGCRWNKKFTYKYYKP